MPGVDFIGTPARDAEARPSGTSRLINVFREGAERSPVICRPVPGTTRWATLDGIFMRAMGVFDGALIVVHGGTAWRVGAGGAPVSLMTVPDSPETTLAGIEGNLIVVADGTYRVYATPGGPSDPAGGAFSACASAVVMARRVVLTERGGRRVQWSNVGAPATVGGLSFATAEQRDGPIIRAVTVGPELWLMKADCIERWYATGSDPAFSYIPGSLIETGLADYRLIAPLGQGAFFVGSDGRAYIAAAGSLRPISTVPVETAIATGQARVALRYRHEGHEFLCITFADRPAWCCDIATGEWHERANGADLRAWDAVASAEAYGARLLGTDNGAVLALGSVPVDDGEPMARVMVSRTIQNAGRPFRVASFQAQGHVGQGEVDPAGIRDPQVMMRTSRDSGRTWSRYEPRSLGGAGEYETRLLWRSLGQFRDFTVELRCTEPLDVSFDATAFVEMA